MSKSEAELIAGALEVAAEWVALAELAADLHGVVGAREPADDNAMEAFLVHYRCMVNFVCGDYKGRWWDSDIKPFDFIGGRWKPEDAELDQRMRGRLPIINQQLQHLSWQRVLYKDAVKWGTVFMAHEVSYAMARFIEDLERERPGQVASNLRLTLEQVAQILPAWDKRDPQTEVPPAPARNLDPPAQ